MDRRISLKYGLIAGGSVVLYFLLFYFLDKLSMLKMWVAFVSVIIYFFFMVIAIKEQRTIKDDMIDFREAISVAFQTFIIASALYHIFFFYIMKVDAELVEMLKQITIDFQKRYFADQDLADIEKNLEGYSISFSDVLLSFAQRAIGGFLLSVLIAATMRRGKRLKLK